MLVKGTRILEGDEARKYRNILAALREPLSNYSEVVVPALGNPQLWIDRSGTEIENQMWMFRDKGDRPTCLIPEVTAVIQNIYNTQWKNSRKKPVRVFYEAKCYRYEQPQAGRYREFTQFGIEILGGCPEDYEAEAKGLLRQCLNMVGVDYEFDDQVVRGLSYYSRKGFEARCEKLGAQKQIAGGGVYAEGCGWAIGVDRLMLAV